MSGVMRGDAAIDQDLSVLMTADLWIQRRVFIKHLLPLFLAIAVLGLSAVKRDLGRGFVTSASGRNKNNSRQKVESTQRRDQFGR